MTGPDEESDGNATTDWQSGGYGERQQAGASADSDRVRKATEGVESHCGLREAPPTLGLFPLHSVLLPGSILSLRVFERRYLDLVRECMRESRGFVGVVSNALAPRLSV